MSIILEKDRSQLLRMAGNIACGFATNCNIHETGYIATLSAKIALETLQEVDKLIHSHNYPLSKPHPLTKDQVEP